MYTGLFLICKKHNFIITYKRSLMNVCIFNNIFEYLQASPADYEKAVVAAKEAWETWAEVTGINQILPL